MRLIEIDPGTWIDPEKITIIVDSQWGGTHIHFAGGAPLSLPNVKPKKVMQRLQGVRE